MVRVNACSVVLPSAGLAFMTSIVPRKELERHPNATHLLSRWFFGLLHQAVELSIEVQPLGVRLAAGPYRAVRA